MDMPKKSPKDRRNHVEPKVETPKLMQEYYGIPIIIMILTVVGAALRFYHLDFNSFWLDELSTYTYSTGTFSEMWAMMATGTDYNPPLFFFLEHFVIQIFGANEIGLRFLPALFGTLVIPVMYLVGKEFEDTYVGVIAAAVFTFSPFLIFYSQEARPYMLVLLLCAVLLWLFIRAMKSEEGKDWIYVAIVAAIVVWTHFYAILFVLALALHALWYNRFKLRTLLSPAILGAALILPIIFVLIPLFLKHTSHAPTYGMQGIVLIYNAAIQGFGFADYAAAVGLALFVLGMMWMVPREPKKAYLILLIIGVTVITSIWMSYKMPMLPRYMVFMLIPLSLGIATSYKSIKNLGDHTPIKITAVIIILFAVIAVPYYSSYYQQYSKENWRGIANELESITSPGDTIVVVPYYVRGTLGFYYSPTRDKTTYTAGQNLDEISAIKASQGKSIYYVVTSDINAEDPSGKTVAFLDEYSRMFRNYGSVWIAKGV